ncbi:hypothetical protein MHM84_09645 [Halomonas sp. McH1-25]|uniref:hypothetical protein n=1 Tax=Halomonas sp. McH1-25 TaxID=2917740 RepID=UPI001EF5D551|nr:hypothetical protein [Halomonas sp. McH1-25]MCG7600052.1 hypothetical protein [Halomonas sp. McH1-25]
MQKAYQRAVRKAQARCAGAQPLVIERQPRPEASTFDAQPALDAPPPDEVADMAATTHEGESPAIRLGFQCTLET